MTLLSSQSTPTNVRSLLWSPADSHEPLHHFYGDGVVIALKVSAQIVQEIHEQREQFPIDRHYHIFCVRFEFHTLTSSADFLKFHVRSSFRVVFNDGSELFLFQDQVRHL